MPLKKIGKISGVKGLKGQVRIYLLGHDPSILQGLKTLVVGAQSYIVQKISVESRGVVASLQGVADRNSSEALIGLEVFMPSESLVSKPGEKIFLSEIQGFDVLIGEKTVGKVVGFSSNGPQDLLEVQTSTHRSLVPLIKEFLVNIDFKDKKIHMNLPEGLLDEV